MAPETASRLPFIREPARASWAMSLLSVWRRCARWTITSPRNTQGDLFNLWAPPPLTARP